MPATTLVPPTASTGKSKKARAANNKRRMEALAESDKTLSAFLFGDTASVLEQTAQPTPLPLPLPEVQKEQVGKKESKKRARAWVDEDEDTELQERERKLRRVYNEKNRVGGAAWASLQIQSEKESSEAAVAGADLDEDEKEQILKDMAEEDDIFKTTRSVLAAGTLLPKENLSFANLQDCGIHKAKSVQFHPSGRILLVRQGANVVALFQFEAKSYSLIHAFDFPKKVLSCCFSASGSEILVTVEHHVLHTINMDNRSIAVSPPLHGVSLSFNQVRAAKDGKHLALCHHANPNIRLLSATHKKLIKSFKHNADVVAMAFSHDSETLYSADAKGTVYMWDLRMRKCIFTHKDKGGARITTISPSPSGEFYAIGCRSGVVNVYNTADVMSKRDSNPIPHKEIFNITHPITELKWNHDSQILALNSSVDNGACVRFVHVPSFTVFRNFPSLSVKQSVVSMDFSPHSGAAVFAHENSVKVLRLFHFPTL